MIFQYLIQEKTNLLTLNYLEIIAFQVMIETTIQISLHYLYPQAYSIDESRELFSASIGQIFYFEDRNVSIDSGSVNKRANSNVVAELQYKPFSNTMFKSTFMYDGMP